MDPLNYLIGVFTVLLTHGPELVGFFLPPLVKIINRDVKTSRERYIVTLIVCFIVAGVLKFNEIMAGDPELFLGSMALIFLESQTVYRLYFKPEVIPIKNSDIQNISNQPQETLSDRVPEV